MRQTFFILCTAFLLLLTGCGEDDNAPTSPPVSQTNEPPVLTPGLDPNPAPGPGTGNTTDPAPGSKTSEKDSNQRSAPPNPCAKVTANWNTNPESSTNRDNSSAPLYRAIIEPRPCYDEVVLAVNGPGPLGYDVGYVSRLGEDGSGNGLYIPGNAVLQVVVFAPLQGSHYDESGHQPGVVFAPRSAYLYGPGEQRLHVIRAVRSAGDFEATTTLGIGVDTKRRFAVDHELRDGSWHIIIKVARS